MREGQIVDGKVWFGFDERELVWLLSIVPEADGFYRSVKQAIFKLEDEKKHLTSQNKGV